MPQLCQMLRQRLSTDHTSQMRLLGHASGTAAHLLQMQITTRVLLRLRQLKRAPPFSQLLRRPQQISRRRLLKQSRTSLSCPRLIGLLKQTAQQLLPLQRRMAAQTRQGKRMQQCHRQHLSAAAIRQSCTSAPSHRCQRRFALCWHKCGSLSCQTHSLCLSTAIGSLPIIRLLLE